MNENVQESCNIRLFLLLIAKYICLNHECKLLWLSGMEENQSSSLTHTITRQAGTPSFILISIISTVIITIAGQGLVYAHSKTFLSLAPHLI